MLELMYANPWWTTLWLFLLLCAIPSITITRGKSETKEKGDGNA